MSIKIVCDPTAKNADYRPRNACADLIYSKDPEIILSGPSETGKTLAACWKLHLSAMKYPGANIAMVRKTQASMYGTVLVTWKKVTEGVAEPFGGERPSEYHYANGSKIWIGGLDNPNRVLSAERDIIYVCQAEELTEDEWETLLTRCTGRGAVMPYTVLMGDCNPGGSKHWIRRRANENKLKLLTSSHRDNPTLYTDKGDLTEQGKKTMLRLENLTGVRRLRLLKGIWASAEGVVYDGFVNMTPHVCVRSRAEMKKFRIGADYGFNHPAVQLDIGVDNDGNRHVFQEWVESGKLESEQVANARKWHDEFKREWIAVDDAAAGLIAALQKNGLPARAAGKGPGSVLRGIGLIQDELVVRPTGRPALTIDPSCVNLINGMESYIWKDHKSKDEPVKENDDEVDALRYDKLAELGNTFEFFC